MTDKELRKLKRAELLEILFYLQKEIDNIKLENQELQQRIENLTINNNNNNNNKTVLSDEDLKRIEQTVKNAADSYFSHPEETSKDTPQQDTPDNSAERSN